MNHLLYLPFLLLPSPCQADTFILKDGARLEGEVAGTLEDALLVKTRYGQLTIQNSDIQERIAAPAAAPLPETQQQPLPAAPTAVSTSPAAAEVSTGTGEEIPAGPEALVEAAPKLTFQTLLPGTSGRQLAYSENGIAVATETVPADGSTGSLEGIIPDGTYTEYYPDGGLKTVKTMMAGKAFGTMKAYYPSGAIQAEVYYMSGAKDGTLKYYTEDGKLLLQADYRNDLLNGWKREYGPDGNVTSELYYVDDRPGAPDKAQAGQPRETPAPAGPGSQITVKTVSLARGERFSLQLNNKYIGKLHLDNDYNLISYAAKVPDGTVKVYSTDGKLTKELVFENNSLKLLRIYEPGGPLKAEYTYEKDKAIKK